MTDTSIARTEPVLVAIDISKARHEVLTAGAVNPTSTVQALALALCIGDSIKKNIGNLFGLEAEDGLSQAHVFRRKTCRGRGTERRRMPDK